MGMLADLVEAYQIDRRLIDVEHPATGPNGKCRYCGKSWTPFPRGKFDGHVRCAVTPGFRSRLRAMIDSSPGMSYISVGTALGVSPSIVRAWWDNAIRRGP